MEDCSQYGNAHLTFLLTRFFLISTFMVGTAGDDVKIKTLDQAVEFAE